MGRTHDEEEVGGERQESSDDELGHGDRNHDECACMVPVGLAAHDLVRQRGTCREMQPSAY